MSYSIKVLTNSEFDELPYRDADISLGLADVSNSRVYIRNTHIKELNEYLLDHEVEHLIEETPTDDENGIRYKKFRQAAGNVAAVLGPLVGGAVGGPGGAAIGGAVGGGLKGGIGGEKKSFGGALKGAAIGGATGFGGAKLTGNFGMPNSTIGNLLPTLGTGLKSGFGAGNILPNLGFKSTAGNLGMTGLGGAKAAGLQPSKLFSAGNCR